MKISLIQTETCTVGVEKKRQLDVLYEFSPFPKGIIARILKALKNFLLRLLIVIVLCQASPSTGPFLGGGLRWLPFFNSRCGEHRGVFCKIEVKQLFQAILLF